MSEFKGTPGPWTGLPFHECIAICRQDDADLRLGFVSSSNPERMAEGRANAFLIAAAPELLAAVSAFLRYVDSKDDDTESMLQFAEALDKARSAHAKALGESK